MPKIEVPQRTVKPAVVSGGQLPLGLFDSKFAAGGRQAQAFGQAGQVAGQAAIDTIRAQGEEEFTSAKLDYETAFRTFSDELLTDTDYAGYSKKFDDWHDNFVAERIKGINHPGAQSRAADQFDQNRAQDGRTIDTKAQNKLVTETRRLLPDKLEAFAAEEVGAETPEILAKVVAERTEYFKMLTETGVLTAEAVAAWEKRYQETKGLLLLQNSVKALLAEEDWDAVMSFLNDEKQITALMKDFNLDLADIDKVLKVVKTQAKLSRSDGIVVLEQQREEDSQAILDKILNNDLTNIDTFINATRLDTTGKTLWIDRAEKAAAAINKGTKIVTDERVRAELEDSANDIAIGSVTKEQVLAAANQARYTNEKIDNAAYKSIRALIDTEHTSYQSTAIKEGVDFGRGQLVSLTKSAFETAIEAIALGGEGSIADMLAKRELELWNHGQYRKALNDWLALNPEANADDIYIQSRKLEVTYDRSIEEITTARASFEQRLENPAPIAPAAIKARFANPVRVESPFGLEGWTGEEEFKKDLEPLGYKRVGKNAEDSSTKE